MNWADIRLLPPCFLDASARATTKEEALANIKEAIELYLESLEADGEPIPAEEAVEEAVVEVTM